MFQLWFGSFLLFGTYLSIWVPHVWKDFKSINAYFCSLLFLWLFRKTFTNTYVCFVQIWIYTHYIRCVIMQHLWYTNSKICWRKPFLWIAVSHQLIFISLSNYNLSEESIMVSNIWETFDENNAPTNASKIYSCNLSNSREVSYSICLLMICVFLILFL